MSIRRIGRPKGFDYPIGLSTREGEFSTDTLSPRSTNTTGGTQTNDTDFIDGDGLTQGNTFHLFETSGTFTPSFDGDIDILIVAGGGGGVTSPPGNGGQAGGGAGGTVIKSGHPVIAGQVYSIVIGGGGAATTRGANSSFGLDNVAEPLLVGWGGGGHVVSPTSPRDGGSHSGVYGGANNDILQTNNPSLPADSRTFGYGNYGGLSAPGGPGSGFGGGGGGGAGANGSNGISPAGPLPFNDCNGGIGLATTSVSWLSPVTTFAPTSNYFASGGGGSSRSGGGFGGLGGGGNGDNAIGFPGVASSAGTANRGGGGGGGAAGKAGGSGVILIRYNRYTKTPVYSID